MVLNSVEVVNIIATEIFHTTALNTHPDACQHGGHRQRDVRERRGQRRGTQREPKLGVVRLSEIERVRENWNRTFVLAFDISRKIS